MALAAGARLGRYEILAPLGAGGMGEVYRARDTKLNRDVALKILPDAFAADEERLARFRREAQLLASLNHPNIAHIYGIEDGAQAHAIILELVDGPTLADRIAAGPLPLDEALPIARQIAEALEAAHEHGVIHRDLKPANVKVRDDGTVKVLDFGLAKAFDPTGTSSADAINSPTLTMRATQMGVILGTAAYMAPEQAKGKSVDRRADIWAFGAVLYEMVSGRRAFLGDDISDTLAAVLRQEVDWTALPASTPAALKHLIARCLDRDVRRRLRDIGEARIALENPATRENVAEQAIDASLRVIDPAPDRRSLWRTAALAVLVAMVTGAVGAAGAWYLKPSPPATVARFSITPDTVIPATPRRIVAISPDGLRIVYPAGNQDYIRSISDLNATAIAGTEGLLFDPAFSPDGAAIAFWASSDRTVKRVAATGGVAFTICPLENPFGISWGPDGLVFGQSANIMRVSPNGGQPEVLVTLKDDEGSYGPQMLPDRDHLLFTLAKGTASDRWDKALIVVQSLKSGERKTLIEGGSDARYLPTGHIVYALGGTLFAVPFDVKTLTTRGGPVAVVEGVRRTIGASTGGAQFGVSNSGTLLYVPGPSTSTAAMTLGLADRKGVVEALKLPVGSYEFPRASPDGKRVAFQLSDARESAIWVYDVAAGAAMRRLTFGGNNRFPVWSANGKRVTFQSDRDGPPAIFWQAADGVGAPERLTQANPGEAHVPNSWSPNGDTLLFDVVKGSTNSLSILSLRDRKTTAFGAAPSANPTSAVFSPDGRWVAYTMAAGPTTIYVEPFPPTGSKYQLFAKPADSPHEMTWSPDGKELFYNPRAGGFEVVSVVTEPTFAFGNPVAVPRPFTMGPPSYRRPYDVMPDGRFLVLFRPGQLESGNQASQVHVVLNWFEDLKRRVPPQQ